MGGTTSKKMLIEIDRKVRKLRRTIDGDMFRIENGHKVKLKRAANQGKLEECRQITKRLVRHQKEMANMELAVGQLNDLASQLRSAETKESLALVMQEVTCLMSNANTVLSGLNVTKITDEYDKQAAELKRNEDEIQDGLEFNAKEEDEEEQIDTAMGKMLDLMQPGLKNFLFTPKQEQKELVAPESEEDRELKRRFNDLLSS